MTIFAGISMGYLFVVLMF